MQSFIPADAAFALYGILIGAIALGFWAEQRTEFGKRFTGVMVMMTLLTLLSNLRFIPFEAAAYDTIFSDILPLAIPLLLFRADIRRVFAEAGPTLVAFLFGAVGVVVGVFLGVQLVPLGEFLPELAGVYTATYIGGSLNFATVALAADFNDGATLTAAVAADVVAGHLQMLFLIVLPAILAVRRLFHYDQAAAAGDGEGQGPETAFRLKNLNLSGLSLALFVAYMAVAAGQWSAEALENSSLAIIFTSLYALVVANLFPGLVRKMSGDFEAGTFLIFLFLAAIAASANVWALVASGPVLFVFALIILTSHMVFVLGFGKLFGLGLPEIIIGSTACVGGVTSASAIASAKGWRQLVTPGIMVGTFGNATGSFIGVWVWNFFA